MIEQKSEHPCVAAYMLVPADPARAESKRAKLVALQRSLGLAAAVYAEPPGRRRPQRRRLIGRARRGDVCVVAVIRWRDLAPSRSRVAQLVVRLGVPVVSGDGLRLDPADPVLRWLAKEKGEHRRTVDAKRARGERLGEIPMGYRLDPDGVHLVPNVDEQRAIARARELADVGTSRRRIARVLTIEGYRSRRGGPITHVAVGRWLATRNTP